MKTTVHVVPHAHWDREWYLPFEWHRARLVKNLDDVLSLLSQDDYTSYHLDGQMIAVEDYLQIRPENRELLKKYVRKGRLKVGPWYVLQDEFLTSGEANVRNLLCGLRIAAEYGETSLVGYLPDAFGNVSQMPQLLSQAGMTAAAFGRGVSLVGRGQAHNLEDHQPSCSEFLWESPDGSRIPALYFSGWYNNGQEIPADPGEAKAYWDQRLAHARKYAATEHLLFMNGSDHQPVQKDLLQALETARELYPDIEFLQSDMDTYAKCVLESLTAPLEVVSGELAGQETEGNNTLCNTASARCCLKALNRQNEVLLERLAEPLAAIAGMAGMNGDKALLDRAWKLLMQNHPHDSICGCSIDEVHRETRYRYDKSIQIGNLLTRQAGEYLSSQIAAPRLEESAAAFALWNTSGWERTQVVEAEVCTERVYGTVQARKTLLERPVPLYQLVNSQGMAVPCAIEDLGVHFGFDLPDDSFRRPYFERRIKITFQAEQIPAFGYETFYIQKGTASGEKASLVTGSRQMENRFVKVELRQNGTFDLTVKESGRSYRGLGYYEDVGDVGDEYIFRSARGKAITTLEHEAEIACLEDSPYRAVFQIIHHVSIPKSADDTLREAMESMEPRLCRQIGRGAELTRLEIKTLLALEQGSPVVRVHTEFVNTAMDHRLRMVFPTDLETDFHLADSVFDVLARPDVPGKNWTNESRCNRMQYFVAAEDRDGGLAVVNRGAYEYEVLPQRKQLAVTLLRAVGELGDWGVFPTPEAQCQGSVSMDLGLWAYGAGQLRRSGCRAASQFQADLSACQIFEPEGALPDRGSFLELQGDGLAVTCLKPAEDGQGYVLRFINTMDSASEAVLRLRQEYSCWQSNIVERKQKCLHPDSKGLFRIPVREKEIVTIRFEN